MLSDKKCSYDKTGVGFDKFAASSSYVTSTSRTMFVKLRISDNQSHVDCVDKGKNVSLHDHVKVKSKIPVTKKNLILDSFLHFIIVVSLVILDLIVFKSVPKNLGLNSMFLER
jgi:homoserine kinase